MSARSGTGIVLRDLGSDLYLAGFDLDSCLGNDGALTGWAEPILKLLDSKPHSQKGDGSWLTARPTASAARRFERLYRAAHTWRDPTHLLLRHIRALARTAEERVAD
jgi:hypothetical protein